MSWVKKTWRKLAIVFLGAALSALPAESQAAAPASPTVPITVRFASSLSTTTFPILYGQEKGLFAKRGLDLQVKDYADFAAVYTAFRAQAADMGSGGLASIVNLRGHGVPIKVLWGTSQMSNDILVQSKSGLTDPKTLKGKRIGIFGGASGTTANMFNAIMIEDFGFDPRSEAEIRYGAPGLLAGLLARGELTAFVSNDPITAIEMASGRAISIGELSDFYAKQHGGYHPHAGALAVTDSFQKEHPEAVEAFLGVWLQAIRALESDPDLWRVMLKKYLHIDDAATATLLRQRVVPLFALEWTQKNIDGEITSLQFVNKTAGKGFLDKIPADAFVTHVSPR